MQNRISNKKLLRRLFLFLKQTTGFCLFLRFTNVNINSVGGKVVKLENKRKNKNQKSSFLHFYVIEENRTKKLFR